ncbi:MAG: hypothetical protein IKP58_16280 [Victivallales bacterium]|nr:hypothetical protein [Victivallales bacterium]MBR6059726.1 hypothetical protein [Victivallales bacterium]
MKSVAWNAINLELPDEWELLQFSKSADNGKIAFADRYQFRLEIDWSTVSAPPDLDRMASDYKSKLAEEGTKDAKLAVHLPWKGISAKDADYFLSRYVNYFPSRSLMLEAVFIWPDDLKPSPAFEGKILDSIQVASYQEDAQQHWKAFGLDFYVKDDHYLYELIAEPAKTQYMFRSTDRHEVETIARRGMVKEWMKIPVDQWLAKQVPKEYEVSDQSARVENDHQVYSLTAKRKPTVLVDWIHGTRTITASAWICPKDHRLYMAAKLAPAYKKGKKHAPLKVACCDSLEILL